jgi:purine-cytosine permease-like protein
VAALGALALGSATVFGWVGIGALLGERILRSTSSKGRATAWAAVLGTLLISLLTMFVGAVGVRCLGFISSAVSIVLGLTGLGAVALSRFGSAVFDPRVKGGESPADPPAAEDSNQL